MELPPAFPDELLLGRLMRHIILTGESACSFSSRVFGSSRLSLHPFLTAGISRIAEMSCENADNLLVRQTLAPLFFFYLPKHANALKEDLLRGDGAKALRHSQLPSFGCGGSLHLKWCPRCVEQDIHDRGVAYWHRAHQVPGVTACWLHQIRLMSTELKARQRLNEGLPTAVHCDAQAASAMENEVAIFGFGLLAQLEKTKPDFDLEAKYRSRLNELGFITSNGSVRRKALMKAFSSDLAMYPMQGSLFPRHQTDYHYISELLAAGKNCHPFRHLLLGAWLFNSANKMFQHTAPIEEVCSHQPKGSTKEEIEQRCLSLLREGHSLAAVYRKTGKSRCYLKRLAALHDIKLYLMPKQLNDVLKQKIIRLAVLGVHRRRISEVCGIGLGSVEQAISSEPGLVEMRKRSRHESKRRSCRVQILRYIVRHPEAMRRDIKSDCNAAFFWLYHNDRKWLENVLPMAAAK
ncbi:TnsD family Tn7-like transposition protein [Enterovibrio norvegicus]|uniref:TnsD family Tn7-like transposition protein n=1 Tax=Enterovibrio norvegicus TaxID=188144 RepID=UPI0024B0ADDC|nr:TnsD family Tn7-like transposition protein [Enterovibrio norvegicus]